MEEKYWQEEEARVERNYLLSIGICGIVVAI